MRWLLNAHQYDPNVHTWVDEKRCQVSEKRSVVSLLLRDELTRWFDHFYIPHVRAWQSRYFGMSGTLLSLMTEPMCDDIVTTSYLL